MTDGTSIQARIRRAAIQNLDEAEESDVLTESFEGQRMIAAIHRAQADIRKVDMRVITSTNRDLGKAREAVLTALSKAAKAFVGK